MNCCRGQDRPIRHPDIRPPNLAAQNRKLMPEHEQLNVFHVEAATTTNKRAQQSPNGE